MNDGQRERSYRWEAPANVSDMRHLSGLEQLRAPIEGLAPAAPITATLGFRGAEFDLGWAVFEGEPGDYLYNNIGTVHGGYFATLLDAAMSCAVQSDLPPGWGYSTVDLRVSFVRPLTVASGRVRAEGKLIHRGRKIGQAEGRLYDAAGRLCAHGSVTCAVFELG